MSIIWFNELAMVGDCIRCLSSSDKVESSFRSVPGEDTSHQCTLECDTHTHTESIVVSNYHHINSSHWRNPFQYYRDS